jgi:hypothetical protein
MLRRVDVLRSMVVGLMRMLILSNLSILVSLLMRLNTLIRLTLVICSVMTLVRRVCNMPRYWHITVLSMLIRRWRSVVDNLVGLVSTVSIGGLSWMTDMGNTLIRLL